MIYSSVGHGGASGYFAVMALLHVSSSVTRAAAPVLNVFVASFAFIQFYRAGHFDWKVLLPFAAASIPTAFVGGIVGSTPGKFRFDSLTLRRVLAVGLLLAGAKLIFT